MDIKIFRERQGPPPPVSEVAIYLDPEEARILSHLLGSLSFNSVMELTNASKSRVHDILAITTGIYSNLKENGVLP